MFTLQRKEYIFLVDHSSDFHWNSVTQLCHENYQEPVQESTPQRDNTRVVLLGERNTPEESIASSPAQRMMTRRTKTRMPTAACNPSLFSRR